MASTFGTPNSPVSGPPGSPAPETIGPSTAVVVAALASASSAVQDAGGATYLVLPNNYNAKDITEEIEKHKPMPERKRGTVLLHSVDSLLVYCADQGAADSAYIYADVDQRTLTAVFDDFKGTDAAWRQHRALFKMEFTPEAAKWFAVNGKEMTQSEFAEFIEDNFADLHSAAQTLLDVATTISATTSIDFGSAKRLDNGQVQLTYNEMIDAKAGANGTLTIPKTFALGLRLFKGDKQGYEINCRLKYRLHASRVSFRFEMDRPERVIEDAFTDYVRKVSESGYTVLAGKA